MGEPNNNACKDGEKLSKLMIVKKIVQNRLFKF